MKVRVAEARKEAGLTLEQLAVKAGLSYRAVQYIEHGRDVKLSSLAALAGALDCSIHDLINENGDAA